MSAVASALASLVVVVVVLLTVAPETVKLPTRILPSAQVPPSADVHTSGVLVVDDHDVTRSTIQSFLRLNSVPVCGEAANGKQAVEKVEELRPEVVLLDIEMPVMNGIQAAYEIRRISPSTKILFFTIHKDEAVTGARLMGAEGYVTKSAAGTELIPALERLLPTFCKAKLGRIS